jgi:hydrogenase expression/formation protein HypE
MTTSDAERQPRLPGERITMAHGAGGKATQTPVEALFLDAFRNPRRAPLEDQAVFFIGDSFVVTPLFFPGGCLVDLAVNGTVNDLAVGGARPLYLSAGFVLEEGFAVADLRRIVDAMATAARAAEVSNVTGDTKVGQRGKGDGCYVTTAGLGVIEGEVSLGAATVQPGDAVLVAGPIGEHGITTLLARSDLDLAAELSSDTACLWPRRPRPRSPCWPAIRSDRAPRASAPSRRRRPSCCSGPSSAAAASSTCSSAIRCRGSVDVPTPAGRRARPEPTA